MPRLARGRERGGARACNSSRVRLLSMNFSSPPQFGPCCKSRSLTRLGSLAQPSRTGW